MIKINIVKIDKTNFILQLLFGMTVILGCIVSKVFMLVAIAISVSYIFGNTEWEQKFSFFMFAFLFSSVFKFSSEQTSLFMFLRVAIVFSFAFQNGKRFSTSFLLMILGLFVYVVTFGIFFKTNFLVQSINMVLWICIGYVLVNTVSSDKATPVACGLSNGIIITGIIGLFIKQIPQFNEIISVIVFYAEDGALVSRYAGLTIDPNFFTVSIVSALWFIYFEFNKKHVTIVEFISRCAIMSFLGLMTMSKSCVLLLVIFWLYVLLSKNNIQTSAKIVLFFSMFIALMVFVWKYPYWITDLLYRFTGSNDNISADVITTGRTEIWGMYLEKIMDGFNWLHGYGIGAKLVEEKASHNTILHVVYHLGVVGLILLAMLLRSVYISALDDYSKHRSGNLSRIAFFSLLLSLMFLDGLDIESVYYMLFMCLVYMAENVKKADLAN